MQTQDNTKTCYEEEAEKFREKTFRDPLSQNRSTSE